MISILPLARHSSPVWREVYLSLTWGYVVREELRLGLAEPFFCKESAALIVASRLV
jgi:hypothetical protein